LRRRLDLLWIRHIERKNESFAPRYLDLSFRRFQSVATASK
jgi:hypothetical protein